MFREIDGRGKLEQKENIPLARRQKAAKERVSKIPARLVAGQAMEDTMAGSVNKVILVGNLGRDPEIRTLNSGDRVASFSIATSETWRDRTSGERKERTEWHRISIFNDNLVKVAEQYLRKGSKVYIEGAQTRKYNDAAGVEKQTTEVVLQKFRGELTMLDGRGDGDGGARSEADAGGYSAGPRAGSSGPRETFTADLDDEIPF